MKKKMFAFVLAFTLFCLGGCNKPGTNSSLSSSAPGGGAYTDGVYTAYQADFEHGWKEYVKLTVKDGNIDTIEFDAVNEAGDKKTDDEDYRNNMAAGNKAQSLPETYPEKFYPQIVKNYEDAKYKLGDMEMVAGATHSCESFKLLMGEIEKQLKAGTPGDVVLRKYTDGVYTAKMQNPYNGYYEYLTLTVENDTITAVEFDGKDENGGKKTENEQYQKQMIAANAFNGLAETDPKTFTTELANQVVDGKTGDEIELVAGATYSSKTFKKLLAHAITAAKNGTAEPVSAPLFEEGEYIAKMQEAKEGWTEFVRVVIEGGAIAEISFDALDEYGGYKSKDAAYKEQMIAGGVELLPEEFYGLIIANYIESGYIAQDMEMVVGATTSSHNFQKLVLAALEMALFGDAGPQMVE